MLLPLAPRDCFNVIEYGVFQRRSSRVKRLVGQRVRMA
jgi:hypothetical protein